MALATEQPTNTIAGAIADWKHEIEHAERDALWAIFGYDPADPKGSHDRLAKAWNRGNLPSQNLIAFYEAQINYMDAQGKRIAEALTAIGIDLKALLRGELAR